MSKKKKSTKKKSGQTDFLAKMGINSNATKTKKLTKGKAKKLGTVKKKTSKKTTAGLKKAVVKKKKPGPKPKKKKAAKKKSGGFDIMSKL